MTISKLFSAVCAVALAATPAVALEVSANGLKEIPALGLGTWLSDRDKVRCPRPG